MIRFIDLGDQIDEDSSCDNFAFFNTVSNSFIEMCDEQVWDNVEEFIKTHGYYAQSNMYFYPLDRFLSLIPQSFKDKHDTLR